MPDPREQQLQDDEPPRVTEIRRIRSSATYADRVLDERDRLANALRGVVKQHLSHANQCGVWVEAYKALEDFDDE